MSRAGLTPTARLAPYDWAQPPAYRQRLSTRGAQNGRESANAGLQNQGAEWKTKPKGDVMT